MAIYQFIARKKHSAETVQAFTSFLNAFETRYNNASYIIAFIHHGINNAKIEKKIFWNKSGKAKYTAFA